jgi:hypothetical protein
LATHTAIIFADAESSSVDGFNLGSSGNRITLGADDTLSVQHGNLSNSSGAATISNFSTSAWVSGSDLSVSRGNTVSKDVKSSPTESTFDLSVSINGYTSATIYIEIVSAVDTEPDDFSSSLSNITNAIPGVEYALGNFTVAGINTQVTATVSGTASPESQLWYYGNKNAASKNVSNNARLYIWGTASTSYNDSTTATIQVGSRTVSKTITTRADPAVGTRIPFTPSSGAISLDDVRSFFGPKTGTGIAMSDYYRGGDYVIDSTTGTPNNSELPTSGEISLDDFYNSFTTMFFSTNPGNREGDINTTSAAGTTAFNWNRVDDWEVGYGPDMEDGVDYRITHETTTFQEIINNVTTYKVTFNGVDRDLTVAANRSAYSFGYAALGGSAIDVTLTAPQNTEAFISGAITLQIRHKEQPTYVYSTTFYYDYTIYGP